ncbi:MAG: protein kinase [Mogibacterium sp.]|nr:protein kinase [Mogibacterium sp.]
MDVGNYWREWEITELVGAGSYGKVFKIRRTGINNFVEESALKVIRIPQNASDYQSALSEGMDDESVSAYFESIVNELSNEFALMSRLKGNTNIVSFEDYEVVRVPDDFGWEIFIRMEFLTPLTSYIANKEITVKDVARIGIDICKALEVCEKEKIIHRDIKPENIFVSSREDFKLGDFGIAKKLENTSVSLTKKGTLSYMAPEVYKGQPYTASVDIYSLGIVLYRLLNYNRNPFMPPYPERIQYHHREEARVRRMSGEPLPPPISAPEDFARVILKACAYDPANRFPDARSMRQAIESIVSEDEESLKLYLDQSAATETTKTLRETETIAISDAEVQKPSGTGKKKLAIGGAVLAVLLIVVIAIFTMPGDDSVSDAALGNTVSWANDKITGAAEDAVPEQTAAKQDESADGIEYPDYSGKVIRVTNSQELRNAVQSLSGSSSGTIEIEPGVYNDGKPLIINSSDIKLMGVGDSKPVIGFMIQVDANNVMIENLSIEIKDPKSTATSEETENNGILCQSPGGKTYIKNTDIDLSYDTDYIIYGVMVYSPVVMSGCSVDVSHSANGNVAVGANTKFTASGNTFISNDLGMSVFGDSSGMTQEDLQEIVNNNTFQAPTRISAATTF